MTICPFTNEPCIIAKRIDGCSVESTSSISPALCIKKLSLVIEDLNNEIEELDGILERYREFYRPQ